VGHWVVKPIPACGCEACDETLDQQQRLLESMVDAPTSGRLTESSDSGCGAIGGSSQERLNPMRRPESGGLRREGGSPEREAVGASTTGRGPGVSERTAV
jgi:hypothetical protein